MPSVSAFGADHSPEVFAKTCHSDTRQAIAMAEGAFFSVATIDAYRLGGLNYLIPAAQSLLALGGNHKSFLII